MPAKHILHILIQLCQLAEVHIISLFDKQFITLLRSTPMVLSQDEIDGAL